MHSLPLRALALALLALPAAACGPGPGGPSRTAGPPVGPVPSWTLSPAATALDQADTERAARVARDWPGSENERLWNSTYLPYQVPAVWLPPGGLRSGPDQSAYQSGRVDLRAVLPFSPATGEVRWADGRTLALPLITAAQIVHGLGDGKSCGGDCSARLTVSAVRAGTRQVFTARGQATIPTWEFTVDGYRDPFVYPAVAGAPFPQVRLTPDPGTGLAGVGGWTATSADGLTLSAHETTGGCERPLPGQVYETGTAVVLIGHTSLVTGMACTQELRSSPADFRLSHPLGDRVVLDAYTGRAMALLPPELVGPTH